MTWRCPTSLKCGGAAASLAPGCSISPLERSLNIRTCNSFSGRVSDSGEGRWTANAAIDTSTPAPVLTAALFQRFSSRGEDDFPDRLLSAMRYQFGGHLERPVDK
jgi:6-phosphogluconate dehydrogenase (decarboxylating)